VNRIVQRYRCVRCAKTFSESQPLDGLRVDFKQAEQVVHLLCEGMGIRAISRFTRLDTKTILNILETAGQKAAAFQDAKVYGVGADVIQADEINSFVYSKQRNTPADEIERGDQFTFL
jgi:transposase-like protein